MDSPLSFTTSAVMLSFPGALFRFSHLRPHSPQLVQKAEEEYFGYCEFARRAVLEVAWCKEVGIELLTPLGHPVPVLDVRTVLFIQ